MPSDTPTFSQWRARPVFISSTFKDMQAERDYLRSHVFSRLEERLHERRHQLEPIDLRLGVETAELGTEEARELLVLKVCLEEIQRSRPFLIVILGDRYGWVPPPERMETATQEAGFKTEVRGKSVTALEIEFGVLKEHSDQRRRSFFYFREPLPYDQMSPEIAAQFSDAHSTDADVRTGYERLTALKQQIKADPDLKSHAHDYTVKWDAAAQRVTGLQEWGDAVFDHLWAALDEETRDFASQPTETWEQRERAALAEFIAQRSRDFTGRETLITQLLDIATSSFHSADPLNTAALNTGTTWGACVTGSPGSGKSALMAELYQRLAKDDSILILANAAGATLRGTEPDAMLRRFISELAAVLGIADPLPENAGPDDVDTAFASLLARAAMKTRVVVLLDALDQFDATPRGQHLTWLRARLWPGNARLIATGITGTAPVEALSQWAGVEELELSALDAADVTEIAKRIWARYHRQVNPEVLRVLSEKKLPDGTPAAGNPLWLTLALEQLNLLDADDFARAERDFTGSPAERLRALLMDIATRMPPDVPALYGWLLDQTEKTFGTPQARAFAVLIALGRFGWREADLLKLVPVVARMLFPRQPIVDFDDLSLAALRRGFRAHLTRHGLAGQLDFFHSQMRQTAQARSLGDSLHVHSIHRCIADHLETLPKEDPLHESELMVHLICSDDQQRAARVLADIPATSNAASGAIQALVRHIAMNKVENARDHLDWIIEMPAQPNLHGDQVAKIADRFNFALHDALATTSTLSIRVAIIDSARHAFERLAHSDPSNTAWQHNLSVSLGRLGDLKAAQGRLPEAQQFLEECNDTLRRLTELEPDNTLWQHNLSVSLEQLGKLAINQGHLSEARQFFGECHHILGQLAELEPANGVWLHGLSASLSRLGEVAMAQGNLPEARELFSEDVRIAQLLTESDPANTVWQDGLLKGLARLGELARAQGSLHEAQRIYCECHSIIQKLIESEPANAANQRELAMSLGTLGEVAAARGDMPEAQRLIGECHRIMQKLVESDPANGAWQFDLAASFGKLGELAAAHGDMHEAQRLFGEWHRASRRLADSDPSNAAWQQGLAASLSNLGKLATARGDMYEAQQFFSECHDIMRYLADADPSNAARERELSASFINLGDLATAQGNLSEAMRYLGECHRISRGLADADPANAARQYELSVSLAKLGDLAIAQGNLPEARRLFEEQYPIIERLTASDRANVAWQCDLSASLERLGDLAIAQRNLPEARRLFDELYRIAQRLSESDPANAVWQRGLAVAHLRLHEFAKADGNGAMAATELRAFFTVLQGMKRQGMHFDPPLARAYEQLCIAFGGAE